MISAVYKEVRPGEFLLFHFSSLRWIRRILSSAAGDLESVPGGGLLG